MLRATWFVPPVLHTLADWAGRFIDRDVEIAPLATASSDEQFEALRDGARDFAVTSMDNVVIWKRRPGGENLRIVAQVENTIAIDLVVRPEIATFADLEGRRLLVDSAENGFVVALHKMIADAGLDYGRNTVIESGGVRQRLEALVAGNGEAALLGPPFTEMAEAAGMRRLASASDLFPGFAGQGIIMAIDGSDNVRNEMARYLAALETARDDCRRTPEAAARRLIAAGASPALVDTQLSTVGDTLIPSRSGIGMIVEHRRVLGRPGGDEIYENLVDPSFLDDALGTKAF